MKKVVRIIAILRLLPEEPRFITVRRLVELLEADGQFTSERTVQRALVEISRCFPLVCRDRNSPYGWSWCRGAKQVALLGGAARDVSRDPPPASAVAGTVW